MPCTRCVRWSRLASALKIEGRYKEADYALTTRAYRAAVDAAWDGGLCRLRPATNWIWNSPEGWPAFLTGTNHQTVVRGRAHRGVRGGICEGRAR